MNARIFFVLEGFVNGDADALAIPAGGGNDKPMENGWYFHKDDQDADGTGPYDSRQEVEKAMLSFDLMPKITGEELFDLLFSGKFEPMPDIWYMGFAGASKHARVFVLAETQTTLIVDWDNGIHIEAFTDEGHTYVFDADNGIWGTL